jgi:hypothetical protein
VNLGRQSDQFLLYSRDLTVSFDEAALCTIALPCLGGLLSSSTIFVPAPYTEKKIGVHENEEHIKKSFGN